MSSYNRQRSCKRKVLIFHSVQDVIQPVAEVTPRRRLHCGHPLHALLVPVTPRTIILVTERLPSLGLVLPTRLHHRQFAIAHFQTISQDLSTLFDLSFLARDSIYAERAICYRPSVCPFVRPSVCHTGVS